MKPETFYRHCSTCLGIGFLTNMPGTVASAVAFLVYLLVPVPLLIVLALGVLGGFAAQRYALGQSREDPSEVVIDEVIGTWIAVTGLPPGLGLPALFLFRVFDIIKPFPVNTAEKLPGGLGIMADDVVAGLYANVIVRAVEWLFLAGGFATVYERIF
ncbi:MAG: phosphatidylglycerophosphatase A [Thermovirgaceae bacterium]